MPLLPSQSAGSLSERTGLDSLRRRPRGAGIVRLRAALQHRLPFRRGTPYLLTLHLPPLEEQLPSGHATGRARQGQQACWAGAETGATTRPPTGSAKAEDLAGVDAEDSAAAPLVELSAHRPLGRASHPCTRLQCALKLKHSGSSQETRGSLSTGRL